MNTIKQYLLTATLIGAAGVLLAMPPYVPKAKTAGDITTRAGACARPTAQRDLEINNVRAKLWNGGDMWWNHAGSTAAYIVPKSGIDGRFPSSLFAGGIWVGGYDDSGQEFIAATTYGNGNSTGGDWYPGPLSTPPPPPEGTPPAQSVGTTAATCKSWDNMFEVKGSYIEILKREFYENGNTTLCSSNDQEVVTALEALRKWPARGNADFSRYYPFDVPDQEMAPFFDYNNDGRYNPCEGDFPKISIRGCEDNGQYQKAQYGDQMFWWVYNDQGAGGIHNETKGLNVMHMEVQVQAFAYASDDALNNMTFYRYKLLNRAAFSLKETYMSLWSDPDLGCSTDDFIGCINDVTGVRPITRRNPTTNQIDTIARDTITRSMGYVYNSGTIDAINCATGAIGYGTQIPILGVDYFRGPRDLVTIPGTAGMADTTFFRELGMTSFSYWWISGNSKTGDPNQSFQYFNYMRGLWRDGTSYYPCGDAQTPCPANPNTTTKFVFPGHPNIANEWSMSTAGPNGGNIAALDYRFLHTTGPFKLLPGTSNEIISGVPWVPNQVYPNPDLTQILAADDLAQSVFDNCFDILDGPDAPELTIIEDDKSLIITLKAVGNNIANKKIPTDNGTTNRTLSETYKEISPAISPTQYPNENDRSYNFEGYRVFQLVSANVDFNKDKDDLTKVREVFNVDVKNNVTNLINWEPTEVPTVFAPKIYKGTNKGVLHSFKVTRDQFAKTGALINHKKYYFKTVAYAYNNYKTFLNNEPTAADRGQAKPYLTGRRGVDKTYIGIPRRTVAESLGKISTAAYGDIPQIIRTDGKGNGGLFLDMEEYTVSDASNDIVQKDRTAGEIAYKRGFGPLEIKVVDPLAIVGGNFLVTLSRDSTGFNTSSPTSTPALTNIDNTYWELKQVSATGGTSRWVSERPIKFSADQYIADLGISLRVAQSLKASADIDNQNGYIGSAIAEQDTNKSWFSAVADDDPRFIRFAPGLTGFLNILATGTSEADKDLDPKSIYSGVLNGWFLPYSLCNCRPAGDPSATPAWQTPSPGTFCIGSVNAIRTLSTLDNLNSVDIVFTSDTTKWSRCIVIETTPTSYVRGDTVLLPQRNFPMGSLRPRLSVNKLGQPDATGTYGYGWFPGYAVDVETGKRLNVFFGESSLYDGRLPGGDPATGGGTVDTGGDMLFNPTPSFIHGDLVQSSSLFPLAFGGFHNVYVMKDEYDGCFALGGPTVLGGGSAAGGPAPLAGVLPPANPAATRKARVFSNVGWTSMVLPKIPMLPIAQGLIPTTTTIKLRVNGLYAPQLGTNSNQTMPQYRFNLDKFVPIAASTDVANTILDEIKVVPNPYYAYSENEINSNDNNVKISNLPPECTVTIYSLDGRFIRQFERNEDQLVPNTKGIRASIDWDVKNFKSIPIASGVYLIHIKAPNLGERVIKWFGVTRAIDASKL